MSIVDRDILSKRVLQRAAMVIEIEAQAVSNLRGKLGDDFVTACQMMLECKGRVIVSGIGKSGHVARKIAATFASTGTPAFFVHPAEASHGDLGMVTRDDVFIALSNSGATEELMTIVPLVKRIGARLIAMTGNPASPLARLADCHLDVGVEREACPLNLAPTASTTAAIAMGDALAVALLDARGFGEEDFASSHPGGTLGRKMLTRVVDVMRTGEQIPLAGPDTRLADALLEMTRKRMGMVLIVADNRILTGIFTDGDLRRLLERDHDIRSLSIGQVMTRNPAVIEPEALASSAARLMEDRRITQLAVVRTVPNVHAQEPSLQLVGALQVHDLLSAKVA
jgi:arabinose-5-phosphate isomerase